MRRSIRGTRMLVTGASSGIGRALAEEAARRGARIVLAARSDHTLQQIVQALRSQGADAVAVQADITRAEDRERLVAATVAHFGGLDILVNNAGVLATGHFADASADRLRAIMEVNFFGAAELIRLAVPHLRRAARPAIVNICSMTGRRGVPARSEYCASKFALIGLSEALRAELAKDRIDVLVVNPGFVATSLEAHMLEGKARREWQDWKTMSAELVARRTLRAIEQGKKEVTIGLRARALLVVNRFAPRLVDRLMARYVKRLYEQ